MKALFPTLLGALGLLVVASNCGITNRCEGVICPAPGPCQAEGVCNTTTGLCEYEALADGLVCNDNDACTNNEACHDGNCVGVSAVVCSAMDACHVAGVCNPDTGVCDNPIASNGRSCDNQNLCTFGDSCQEGICVSGDMGDCTPSQACRVAGACNPQTGLCDESIAPDGMGCEPADICALTGVCEMGGCIGLPWTETAYTAQHWWKGDGNTNDSVGIAHGSMTGGVSFLQAVSGQGFGLDGTGFIAFSSEDSYPGTGPLTVSAWIIAKSPGTPQTIVSLYECGGECPTGGADAWIALSVTSQGHLSGSIRGEAQLPVILEGEQVIDDGQFHHVAMVRDTAASMLRIYVNGVLDGQASIPVDEVIETDGEMDPICIGGRISPILSTPEDLFQGVIDDVRWFKTMLPPEKIEALACN